MQAILIYTCNHLHEYSSMELIAIATTEKQRDRLIRRFLREYLYEKPSAETIDKALQQIQETGNTQCLAGECDLEIHTESYRTNIVL